jgi:hypothetical protein
MISRREFLKLSGLAAGAFTTGILSKKILFNSESFSIYGFIPANEKLIKEILMLFKSKTSSNPQLIISSDMPEVSGLIFGEYKESKNSNEGFVSLKIKKIHNEINGDILVSDSSQHIYLPEKHFSLDFIELRNKIKTGKADILFSAEYKSGFYGTYKKRYAIIESEKGIIDKINLENNYGEIPVNVIDGKIILKVKNEIVSVASSHCKYGICKTMFASFPGDIVACAPNKLMVKIVSV